MKIEVTDVDREELSRFVESLFEGLILTDSQLYSINEALPQGMEMWMDDMTEDWRVYLR